MIIDTTKILYCKHTGKALNTIPKHDRECISKCLGKGNRGTLGSVLLAMELTARYKGEFKRASRKTTKFLNFLFIRLIENSNNRYINVKEHKEIPLKTAGLRKVMENLEALEMIDYYKGWTKTAKEEKEGSVITQYEAIPSCIRINYPPDELEAMKDQAIENYLK